MELYALTADDPRTRPGLCQFVQDVNGKPFAAMLSTKLLDRFPHPDYPWRWTVNLAYKVDDQESGMPGWDEFEAVKTFALGVFDRLNLEFDVRLIGTTIYRGNAELGFLSTEAEFPRIAGTFSEGPPGDFGAERWRFRQFSSVRDPAWEGFAALYQVVRRLAPRSGTSTTAAPTPPAADLRMKPEIQLRSGRSIRLLELRQSRTYEGLIMGLPTAENNRQLLNDLPRSHSHYQRPAYLVQPVEKPLSYNGPSGEPYAFGTPASLPAILCVARFESHQPARDKSDDASGLAVVWFQQKFAFPIDDDVVKAIAAIDWEAHAGDFSY